MFLHRTQHHLLHAADLHFDIEKSLVAETLQNIFQAWRLFFGRATSLKLLERMLADHQTVELGIMADNGLPVGGRADVKLKAVGAVL